MYTGRVYKIKSAIPYACIGVDVIVGFPGETHDDFLETYSFLNELNISYLHVFTYSERENTVASSLPGVVPLSQRSDRSKMLHILSDKKKRKFYEENIGRESTILFENDIENGKMHGFTENYIRAAAKYDPILINELRRATLSSINENGVVEVEELSADLQTHHHPA